MSYFRKCKTFVRGIFSALSLFKFHPNRCKKCAFSLSIGRFIATFRLICLDWARTRTQMLFRIWKFYRYWWTAKMGSAYFIFEILCKIRWATFLLFLSPCRLFLCWLKLWIKSAIFPPPIWIAKLSRHKFSCVFVICNFQILKNVVCYLSFCSFSYYILLSS